MTDDDLPPDELQTRRQLVADQREANARLVHAVIAALEQHEEAEEARERSEEARERAEARASELRDDAELRELFIGILGHDLRTPLASISSCADALRAGGHLDPDESAQIGDLQRNVQRMTQMVTQLLDLTRARLGGLIMVKALGDLAAVARGIVDQLADPRIELEVRDPLRGAWDADRMGEVVGSIAGNALEHASAGSVVRIEVYRVGNDGFIAVHNQGPAIAADVLPVLFEPFRIRRARRANHLGLGLYLAHQIVVGHRGTITAHSAHGTTSVVVRVPLDGPAGLADGPTSSSPR